jgi:hypothetical protein
LGGAAGDQGPDDASMAPGNGGSVRIQISLAVSAQDVGDLQHGTGRALWTIDELVDRLAHVVHDALGQVEVDDRAFDVGVSQQPLNRSCPSGKRV